MNTAESVRTGQNATLADCQRLWSTLTNEYIPGLRVQLTIILTDDGSPALQLELVDGPLISVDGSRRENVWAKRVFFNKLHLISIGPLFDLLISGYRAIDDFFTYGESYAPARRDV